MICALDALRDLPGHNPILTRGCSHTRRGVRHSSGPTASRHPPTPRGDRDGIGRSTHFS
jgi:hypothetical protein